MVDERPGPAHNHRIKNGKPGLTTPSLFERREITMEPTENPFLFSVGGRNQGVNASEGGDDSFTLKNYV